MEKSSDKVLRIIHHWPCSGGTLISKCIASYPNIVFLSEVHPYAYLRHMKTDENKYLPTDIIRQLSFQRNGRSSNLCNAAFLGAIQEINKKTSEMNKKLVIRDHSYIDYFVGPLPRKDSLIHEIFSESNQLLRILTVRHPLDSWLSLKLHQWDEAIQFNSFDEYCLRIKIMISAMKDVPIFYYEKFCINPELVMRNISKSLDIKFNKSFLSNFNSIKLSGDSGRKSQDIFPRERRNAESEFKKNIMLCENFLEVCNILNYEPSFDASFPYLIN